MQIGGAYGMVLMNDSLVQVVRDCVVDPQQAYDKAVDRMSCSRNSTNWGSSFHKRQA